MGLNSFHKINHFYKTCYLNQLIDNHLQSYIQQTKTRITCKTGFQFMDNPHPLQKFYPGCYLIGAIPGIGKTTFCYQLGEQLAEHGTPVLFVSCEMLDRVLIFKSIARRLKLRNPNTSITNQQLQEGITNSTITTIIDELKSNQFPFMLYHPPSNNLLTVEELMNKIDIFCDNFTNPVIIIDYLQILETNKNFGTDKQKIDYYAKLFIETKNQHSTATFIVISQFNRASYHSSVSMESFKETGGIEYFADVMWGLQYNVFEGREVGTRNKGVTHQEIDTAISENPRKLMLRCLKNRFGTTYKIHFDYYPQYDLFTEKIVNPVKPLFQC